MFYSHEVLTSRKYGVATVWLVATLGSKSSLKKVSRKAIDNVDVHKACETIVTPVAPMALRLQSNLLYGVTRVYSQQCGYVLSDAEAARKNMRLLLEVMHTSTLNVEGENQGRVEQLMLQDDPNYLPDFDLMPLEMSRQDLDLTAMDDTQRSTLSPHSSQQTGIGIGSQHDIGGLLIPQSASSMLGGPFSGGGAFGIRGDSSVGARVDIGGLEDDLGLAIDDDGNLVMIDEPVRQPALPSMRGERTDLGNASSPVRREYEGGQLEPDIFGQQDDDGFFPLQDDYIPAPDAEPLLPAVEQQPEQQGVTSEEIAEAQIRRRPRVVPKIIALDDTKELRNADLARWNTDYVANQLEAIRHKTAQQATALAKKNAEYWILGPDDKGPLSLFTGARLLEALTGVDLRAGGKKRPRDEGYETDEGRRVRSRSQPSSDEIGRGFQDDDGYMPMIGDDTIEQGREAPTPLDERHLSSMMPWNQSTGSRRPTGIFSGAGVPTSASVGGIGQHPGSLPRRPSRLTSASPLMGRGMDGGEMDELQLGGVQGDITMTGLDDFELFGPAAQVDTQTAEQSQWQRAALDSESVHFLEFVQTGIEEMDQARDQTGLIEEEDEELTGTIDLDSLLPPENHSRIVAAQALLHILALGTKNLLAIEQEEPFGPITLRTLGVAASQ